MKRIPRASFSITLLTDEDYATLMDLEGGGEAFGVFAAIVVAGRERLQEGKACRVRDSESLRFENKTPFVLSLARITPERFQRCLAALAKVAAETGGRSWLHVDREDHLIIRSFFKFNTASGWGGSRSGAGRPPSENQDRPFREGKIGASGNQSGHDESRGERNPVRGIKIGASGNQDDSSGNQDDSNLKPTRYASGSGSGSGSEAAAQPAHASGGILPATPWPPDPKMCPPYPDPERVPIDVKSGPHALTDDDSREIFGRMWNLSGRATACNEFYADRFMHSAETWRAAISVAASRGVTVGSVNYLHPIANEIEAGGGRKVPKGAKPAPSAPVIRLPGPDPEATARVQRAQLESKAEAKARREATP